MSNKRKYAALVFMTVLLLALVFGAFFIGRFSPELFCVSIMGPYGEEVIQYWDNEESQIYVFLPSYADMQDVRLDMCTQGDVTIDGRLLRDGIRCNFFSLNTPYELTYDSFGICKRK